MKKHYKILLLCILTLSFCQVFVQDSSPTHTRMIHDPQESLDDLTYGIESGDRLYYQIQQEVHDIHDSVVYENVINKKGVEITLYDYENTDYIALRELEWKSHLNQFTPQSIIQELRYWENEEIYAITPAYVDDNDLVPLVPLIVPVDPNVSGDRVTMDFVYEIMTQSLGQFSDEYSNIMTFEEYDHDVDINDVSNTITLSATIVDFFAIECEIYLDYDNEGILETASVKMYEIYYEGIKPSGFGRYIFYQELSRISYDDFSEIEEIDTSMYPDQFHTNVTYQVSSNPPLNWTSHYDVECVTSQDQFGASVLVTGNEFHYDPYIQAKQIIKTLTLATYTPTELLDFQSYYSDTIHLPLYYPEQFTISNVHATYNQKMQNLFGMTNYTIGTNWIKWYNTNDYYYVKIEENRWANITYTKSSGFYYYSIVLLSTDTWYVERDPIMYKIDQTVNESSTVETMYHAYDVDTFNYQTHDEFHDMNWHNLKLMKVQSITDSGIEYFSTNDNANTGFYAEYDYDYYYNGTVETNGLVFDWSQYTTILLCPALIPINKTEGTLDLWRIGYAYTVDGYIYGESRTINYGRDFDMTSFSFDNDLGQLNITSPIHDYYLNMTFTENGTLSSASLRLPKFPFYASDPLTTIIEQNVTYLESYSEILYPLYEEDTDVLYDRSYLKNEYLFTEVYSLNQGIGFDFERNTLSQEVYGTISFKTTPKTLASKSDSFQFIRTINDSLSLSINNERKFAIIYPLSSSINDIAELYKNMYNFTNVHILSSSAFLLNMTTSHDFFRFEWNDTSHIATSISYSIEGKMETFERVTAEESLSSTEIQPLQDPPKYTSYIHTYTAYNGSYNNTFYGKTTELETNTLPDYRIVDSIPFSSPYYTISCRRSIWNESTNRWTANYSHYLTPWYEWSDSITSTLRQQKTNMLFSDNIVYFPLRFTDPLSDIVHRYAQNLGMLFDHVVYNVEHHTVNATSSINDSQYVHLKIGDDGILEYAHVNTSLYNVPFTISRILAENLPNNQIPHLELLVSHNEKNTTVTVQPLVTQYDNSYDILECDWGDGHIDEDLKGFGVHTYMENGTYTIVMYIQDGNEDIAFASATVTICIGGEEETPPPSEEEEKGLSTFEKALVWTVGSVGAVSIVFYTMGIMVKSKKPDSITESSLDISDAFSFS